MFKFENEFILDSEHIDKCIGINNDVYFFFYRLCTKAVLEI